MVIGSPRVGTVNRAGGRCAVSAEGHGKVGSVHVGRGGCVRSGCDPATAGEPPRMGLVHGEGGSDGASPSRA